MQTGIAISDAITRVGTPPCQQCTTCGNWERCRDDNLACHAFYAYATWSRTEKRNNRKPVRGNPSRKYYDMLFSKREPLPAIKGTE